MMDYDTAVPPHGVDLTPALLEISNSSRWNFHADAPYGRALNSYLTTVNSPMTPLAYDGSASRAEEESSSRRSQHGREASAG